ncbi:lytic transglycosylase domain-containing protein [Pseudoxanthomonas composti]|uniref:Lytic transglycosylase domain-containing protein n=1 Tax=Pseudoxanthomonas composti TaxID=2137479 RepID=A0A4V1N1N0_9GAMM|nr:lytic transglycosylase domain-containing protein [Pseudoxanthomonas composti]RXR08868.1 lytic transglycosylase domain-containing protein [Pseudoxanthomonas composti]
MKGVLRLGMIAAALVALPASAGTLYKCVGGDGITSYVSKRPSGARCEIVSRYTPGPRRAAPVVAAPRPVPALEPAAKAAEQVPRAVPAALSAAAGSQPDALPRPTAAPQRVVSGQVYSYVKDGVRHYTSVRPAGVALANVRTIKYSFIERCYACGNPGVNFGQVRLNTASYQAEIAAAAREYGVDEAIVRAIIHAESAYNPLALSRAGAQGLMQLMPATARRFGVSDSYDASQNIRGGVQYLAWLLKRFNGNLTLAAAGYNAGEGAVDKHGGVPPYSETQRYVQRVGLLADRYRSAVAAQ